MIKATRIEKWRKGDISFSLHREFEFFDPVNTPVLYAPFTAYVREARKILAGRTKEEIEYACMLAEWAVLAPIDELIEEEFGEAPELLSEMTGHDDETFPRQLQRRQSVLSLVGIPDLRKARWQELYAAVTLAYVGKVVKFGDSCSMEAAEAIQIALAAAQRSRSAATKYSTWKQKVLAYAAERDGMSASRIAAGFRARFGKEMEHDLGKRLAPRTIADWIRESRKSIE